MTTIAEGETRPVTSWRGHCLALGAIILLILAQFHDALNAALQVWLVSPTYSHCFLILPISGWLIWEKRGVLRTMEPAVAPRFLWLVPFLVLLWWLGELSTINEVRQYAIVALIQVTILALLGPRVVRVIWFPVFFLLFLVPTGEYLITPMQQFATRFVDIALNLLKIPHYTEGTTFELTNGRFEIAEACAGLRFLIATVTLGVLFCYLTYRKPYKIAIFMIATVLVPLIGNGLRCVGIILLAHFTNNEYGAGADHIVYGWGFNLAILLFLMVIGAFFRDDLVEDAPAYGDKWVPDRPAHLAAITALAAILISTGPAFAWWRDTRHALPDTTPITGYLQTAGWQEGNASGNWSAHYPGADAHIDMTSSAAFGPPIDLFIGYYARPRAGHSMTAHLNQAWDISVWNRSRAALVKGPPELGRPEIQESVINAGPLKRLVWSTYWVNGRFTPRPLSVKLLQAEATFRGREGQAAIALSTPVNGPIEDARSRLAQALSGLGRLSEVLDRANAPAHEGGQ